MIRRKTVSIIAVMLFVAAGASAVLAQGRYGNVYSRGDIDGFIRNLEQSSDVFSRDFKNTGGISSNERRIVDRFENAVDRLRNRFNNNRGNWWQNRTEVQGIMTEARQVNTMMNNDRYGRPLESQWRNLRRDINKLADTYEIAGLAGGNGNGGGYPGSGGYPGGGGNVPSWARGTFYGRNRETGGPMTLNINNDGSVLITMENGSTTYASLNRTTLTNGPYVSRVSRINNGIRTTDVRDGSYIDYTRTPNNSGYPGGYPTPGQGDVPSWAVGTFSGQDPSTGSQLILTIQRNGSVTISVGGAPPVYASMNGTTLTNGPYVSRVTRINNGIRTTDVNNGNYIDYRR